MAECAGGALPQRRAGGDTLGSVQINRRLRSLDTRAESALRKWQFGSAQVPQRRSEADRKQRLADRWAFRSALLSVLGITWIANHAFDMTVPWLVVVAAIAAVYARAVRRT